jgi:hypothetical protein
MIAARQRRFATTAITSAALVMQMMNASLARVDNFARTASGASVASAKKLMTVSMERPASKVLAWIVPTIRNARQLAFRIHQRGGPYAPWLMPRARALVTFAFNAAAMKIVRAGRLARGDFVNRPARQVKLARLIDSVRRDSDALEPLTP